MGSGNWILAGTGEREPQTGKGSVCVEVGGELREPDPSLPPYTVLIQPSSRPRLLPPFSHSTSRNPVRLHWVEWNCDSFTPSFLPSLANLPRPSPTAVVAEDRKLGHLTNREVSSPSSGSSKSETKLLVALFPPRAPRRIWLCPFPSACQVSAVFGFPCSWKHPLVSAFVSTCSSLCVCMCACVQIALFFFFFTRTQNGLDLCPPSLVSLRF